MKWFTSDWHLGDDRIGIDNKPNLFYRPFSSIKEQNNKIKNEFINSGFKDGDTLYDLGDVVFNDFAGSWNIMTDVREAFPKSKFVLIVGNYDIDKLSKLNYYYDEIYDEFSLMIKDREYFLNHYPTNCIEKEFSLTAHIHGLWKVQKNMINVGVDAWHFKPVSEDTIDFCRNAIEKYYDQNVFPY